MAEAPIQGNISGGATVQGIGVAHTVHIENLIFQNRAPEASPPATGEDEPIGPGPYPGLAYFGPEDSRLFFGRDQAIARLAGAVGRQSLTVLAGASGSGKSSVVLAGLAPHLHAQGNWRFSYFRIGHELDRDPFLALARALVPLYVASEDATERLTNTRKLARLLGSGELSLRDVFADVRARSKGSRILLIGDQFEEAFTLVTDNALRQRFIDLLLAGFRDPPAGQAPDISLILTIRADFYGRAVQYRPLADAMQGHVENLGPMTRAELLDAIVKPALGAGVTFEAGLVETLLDEVESRPGTLPLLQFALREMWGRQEHRRITRASYDAIEGVQGALAKRAEGIYADLTGGGKNAQIERDFQRLFTRLVTPGEGLEDTRRVVERSELDQSVWVLAQQLAGEDNRLVVTNAPTEAHATVEVVHEALIRNWPALRGWIDRDRAFLSWLRQIKPNLDAWIANPTDDGPLLRGGMLAQAAEWLARRGDDLSPAERDYIEASQTLQRCAEEEKEQARQAELDRQRQLAEAAESLAREQRRRSRWALAGVVAAVVLAAFGGYQAWIANQNEAKALEAATKARIQVLAAQARRTVTSANTSDEIGIAGALALESIALARASNLPVEADAIEAAHAALNQLPLKGLARGGGAVMSLAALADGRLASCGGGKVWLWPQEGAGEPVVLSQGSGECNSLAVLADGRLASGGSDGKVWLWPRGGTSEPVVLTHGDGAVWSLAVLADGRLASGGQDGKIRIWRRDGKGEPVVLTHGGGPVWSLAVLADGRLASGGQDGKIRLWPRDGTGEPVVLSHGGVVKSLAVLADGRLVSGGIDGKIRLWPQDGTGEPTVLTHGGGPVWSLAVLSNGQLTSGGLDGKVKLWPQDGTGEPVVLTHGGGIVISLAVLADGQLASGGQDGIIRLWPRDGVGQPVVLTHGGGWVTSLAVLADGRLASGGSDGKIRLWPRNGTGEPVVLSQVGGSVPSLVVLADGRLASGGSDGKIRLWPQDGTGQPVVLSHGDDVVWSLAVLADGRLASGGADDKIRLWPRDGTGNPAVLSQDGGRVMSLAALPDGRLASGSQDGTIRLWPSEGAGDPVVLTHGGGGVTSLAVLMDGRLASGGVDGRIRLWPKVGTGESVVLTHGGGVVTSLAALSDGRLASGGQDGKIRVWPRDTGEAPVVLARGGGWVWSLAALADGRLASGSEDSKIRLWLVEEEKILLALCLRAGRYPSQDEWARYMGPGASWQPSCRQRSSNWWKPT